MDQQLSERGLSLRPFDPEVFARVWSRVMPDPVSYTHLTLPTTERV